MEGRLGQEAALAFGIDGDSKAIGVEGVLLLVAL